MPKYLVNPDKCISIKGRPYKAGELVEVDASEVSRLIGDGTLSDPTKPLLPNAEQQTLASFKASPPLKPEKPATDPPSSADAAVKGIVS